MSDTARARPVGVVNLANAFTVLRVVLVPVFAWLLLVRDPALPGLAAVVFAVAAATDGVDGWVARRLDLVSGSGAFLDPLADKLLVGTALVALTIDERMAWVALSLILGREVAVMALRIVLARRGRALPASRDAKVKTGAQILAVLALTTLDRGHAVAVSAIALAVVLTLTSGVRYFLRAAQGRAGEAWT